MHDVRIPPLIVIEPGPGAPVDEALRLGLRDGASRDEIARLVDFGALLASRRAERGCASAPIALHHRRPSVAAAAVAVPHVFVWREKVGLVWEELEREAAARLFGVEAAVVERWAGREDDVLWLARRASPAAQREDAHLSFRWIVRNERRVAPLVSSRVARFEHVSLHIPLADRDLVLRAFVDVLGMVEVSRPTSIETSGHWLQCGGVSVHLSTRAERDGDIAFPGTAPNHVCFVVADLDAAADGLARLGIDSRRAGSLGNQLWFRLPGAGMVELRQGRVGAGDADA